MTARDVMYLCAWIALVGLAVSRGWTILLVGMALSAFVTGYIQER